MKALVLASLIFGTSSVFAQVKEFGAAKCNVSNGTTTHTLNFKIVSSVIVNPTATSVAFKNVDGTYTKVGLTVEATKKLEKYKFTIIAQKAKSVRAALDNVFTDFSGANSIVSFPFAGVLVAGAEANATNLNYNCTYLEY